MYALVDSVSPYLQSTLENEKNIKNGVQIAFEPGIFDIDKITYRAKDLESNPQQYNRLRTALKQLNAKYVEVVLENGDYLGSSMVLKWKFNPRSEIIEIAIDRELFQFLSDISKGYSLMHLKTALDLPSVYAMQMYELIAKWRSKPKFYIDIDDLRFQTNTENIYTKISDFKKNVLDVAKTQLDESTLTDLRFNYVHVKMGRRIVGFDIYVNKTDNAFERKKEINNVSPRFDIPKQMIIQLHEYGVLLKGKTTEIVKNYLIKVGDNLAMDNFEKWRDDAIRLQKKSVAGHIVGAMKNQLKKNK